jgi:DNA primase
MPLIDAQSVEAVRQAVDLAELVRGQVQLVRQGGRWVGRCPFHDERTPSFGLIPPDNRRYYCFGCGATGDAIDWMMQREGAASFADAVEALAERLGVPLRYERASPQEEAERAATERRAELLERAAGFYASYLWGADESAAARGYLVGRGFSEDLLRRFRVGYAPAGGAVLAGRALREGYSRDQLAEAGLARLRGGVAQDFFAGRITFPIADARGQVKGFGARTLDPHERAKYVNSPEGPHFRKRDLLFGLSQARIPAAKGGWTCVVEGYTDVLALAAAGVETAVACMGTSLTARQLRELARAAHEARLCFDADEAGEKAAWRTVEAAEGVNLRLSAVLLPSGADPGDLGRTEAGREELARVVETPKPLVACLIDFRITRAGGSVADRDQALRDITDLLRRLPESVEKDEGVRVAASGLRLSREMERALREASRHERPSALPPAVRRQLSRGEELERRLLVFAVALPEVAAPYLEQLAPGAFEHEPHRRALALLRSGAPPERWPEDLAPLAAELDASAHTSPVTEAELRDAFFRVQLQGLERRAESLRQTGREDERRQVVQLVHQVRAELRGEAR